MPTHDPVKLKALLETCACDSDIERTCRNNWPDDPGSWCGGCQILAVGDAWTVEVSALREARADVLSWAPMLRHLRDSLQKGAENIDAALVAIEFDQSPDCPTCGQPLGGSFPRCAGCQLVEALKRGE